MKHLRIYEGIDVQGVANAIGDILDKYSDKLLIDHIEVHPFEPSIIMKLYRELNSETYKDFRDFFDILDKLELTWLFEGDPENGINFSINFAKFNKKEMDFLIQTKRFNL